MIFYKCDGENPKCKRDGEYNKRCYLKGGDCKHTSDIEYAINFEKGGLHGVDQEYFREVDEQDIKRRAIDRANCSMDYPGDN